MKTSLVVDIIALVLMSIFDLSAYAATPIVNFDCEKAKRPVEYVICSSTELIDAESIFEKSYNSAKADLDDDSKKKLSKNYKQWWKQLGPRCGLSNQKEHPSPELIEQTKDCVFQAFKSDAKYFKEDIEYFNNTHQNKGKESNSVVQEVQPKKPEDSSIAGIIIFVLIVLGAAGAASESEFCWNRWDALSRGKYFRLDGNHDDNGPGFYL